MKHLLLSTVLAFLWLPGVADAQWIWLDKDGRKVFSDRAPAASIPEKSILKRPGQSNTLPTANTEAPALAASAAQPKASAIAPSGIDKELSEKKKKADEAEAAKQKAEEAKMAAARADNCARAKAAKAGLDSGVRLAQINAKGERVVMDDATRAAESQRIQGIIDKDCQ